MYHPSQGLMQQLAARRTKLLAESRGIRGEMQRNAAALLPVIDTIDTGLKIGRGLKTAGAVARHARERRLGSRTLAQADGCRLRDFHPTMGSTGPLTRRCQLAQSLRAEEDLVHRLNLIQCLEDCYFAIGIDHAKIEARENN
jgi:hypothetical protein